MITACLIVLLIALIVVTVGGICWVCSGDFFAFVWASQGGIGTCLELIGKVCAAIAESTN